jgi:deoxyribodipyrimidine photolyase
MPSTVWWVRRDLRLHDNFALAAALAQGGPVFNPVLQGEKFDPEGAYVRTWVPELARVPQKYIHAPWTVPADVQRAARTVIGRDYPSPIVDHAQARERTLSAYRRQASP